jgi:hypothetical protein
MDIKEQITKLRALKEQLAHKQALLKRARKLHEQVSPTNLSKLIENDLEQAKLILAARDVCDKLQKIAEHLAELGAEEIMPLADSMRGAFGPDAAATFEHAANENIQRSLETVRAAKDSINDAILKVEGKLPPSNDMNVDSTPVAPASITSGEQPAPADDPFGGAPAASGPNDEPLGRAKKESKRYNKEMIEGKSFRRGDDDDDSIDDARKKSDEKRKSGKMKRDDKMRGLNQTNENVNLTKAGSRLLEKYSLNKLMDWLLVEAADNLSTKEYQQFVRNATRKALSNPETMAGWIGKKIFGESAMIDIVKTKETVRSERIAEAIAKAIETNVHIFGKGRAARVVESFLSNNGIMENESLSILDVFESKYGMKPAAYSIHISKKIQEDEDDLTQADNTNVASAMGDIASKIATNPTLANQPASTVIQTANPNARSALQKVAGTAGTSGNPASVAQLVKSADDDIDKNKIATGMTEAKRGNKGEFVDDDIKGAGNLKKLKGTNAKNTIATKSDIKEVKRGDKGENVEDGMKGVGHPRKLKGTNAKNTIATKADTEKMRPKKKMLTKEEFIQLGESRVHHDSKRRHPDHYLGMGIYYGGLGRGVAASGYGGCDGEKACGGWDAACSHDSGGMGGSVTAAPSGGAMSGGGMVAGGGMSGGTASVGASGGVSENINAPHWPTDSMGQYKGEPMSTNYGLHDVMMTAPKGKTSDVSSSTKQPIGDKKGLANTDPKTMKTSKAKDETNTEKDNDKMTKKSPSKKSYEEEVVEAAKGKVPTQFIKKTATAKDQEKKVTKSPGPYKQPGSKKHKASDMSKVIN